MNQNSPDFPLSGTEALLSVFRNHASGITVITSRTTKGEPIGFTASSITSLGSNPPLVSMNIAQGSSSYEHMSPGTKVAIHTMDENTVDLAIKFAGPKEQRFSGDEQVGPFELPILECPSVLIGTVRERFEVEKNAVLVIAAELASEEKVANRPLVYFQRGYHVIGDRIADNS